MEGFEEAATRHSEAMEITRSLLEQERANLERECALIQEYGWQDGEEAAHSKKNASE